MSGLGNGYGKVVGLGAAAALALSMVPAGAAQAGAEDRQLAEMVAAARAKAAGLGASATSAGKSTSEAEAAALPSACTLKSYAPNKIVLGASKVSKKFSVKVTGCTLDLWMVMVPAFMGETSDPSSPNFFNGVAGNLPPESGITPTTTLNPRLLRNADAGKSNTAEVSAYGVEDIENPEDVDRATALMPVHLLRNSTFGSTFNASPEPVKKGKSISIKGQLARINWNGAAKLKYVGFAKAKAQLQFKANGATKYVTVKNVVAGKGGKFSTKVKATKSGRWRLYFAGLSTTAPATSVSDAVKVK